MRYRQVEDGYLIRLDNGDEVIDTITKFVLEKNIPGAFFQGLGALSNANIGIYNYDTRSYFTKVYKERLDIASLSGNVAYSEETGQPIIHSHVAVCDSEKQATAGHLFEGTVLVTVEIYMKVFKEKIYRNKEMPEGYNLWRL